jgi:hypothetical protein
LVGPVVPPHPTSSHETLETFSAVELPRTHLDTADFDVDETAMEVAPVLVGGMGGIDGHMGDEHTIFNLIHEPDQMLHMQSLANLLDTSFFSPVEPISMLIDMDKHI